VKKLSRWFVILLSLAAVALAYVLLRPFSPPRAMGLLSQQAYVWQRAWNDPVLEGVSEHATNFAQLVVLAAEVTWRKSDPQTVRVAVDYETLRATRQPVGVALRIGGFNGPFASENLQTAYLADLAKSLVNEARTNGVALSELQLDFDCAESKLEGYRIWVEAIRRNIAPVPVCITALPSWLKRPAFKTLIASADSYVLQVHSLEKPRSFDAPFTLCDSAAAKRAVEKAATFGKPFRVALPTYGYVLAFGADGQYVGLSAEGPSLSWPANVHLCEVRASPRDMAGLVSGWTTNRPLALQGIIWYRLPVATDRLNWSWPTLAAVMEGRSPSAVLKLLAQTPEPELTQIDLFNEGEDVYTKPVQIVVSWQDARKIAADALAGFELVESGNERLTFQSVSTTIAPGQRRSIGWVRLDKKAQVRLELR
jgi:hypothetical protein